tara:strand:- start:67 stop:303 length:237 start_codon:yes stop_codon:yes gene_type:complete
MPLQQAAQIVPNCLEVEPVDRRRARQQFPGRYVISGRVDRFNGNKPAPDKTGHHPAPAVAFKHLSTVRPGGKPRDLEF